MSDTDLAKHRGIGREFVALEHVDHTRGSLITSAMPRFFSLRLPCSRKENELVRLHRDLRLSTARLPSFLEDGALSPARFAQELDVDDVTLDPALFGARAVEGECPGML